MGRKEKWEDEKRPIKNVRKKKLYATRIISIAFSSSEESIGDIIAVCKFIDFFSLVLRGSRKNQVEYQSHEIYSAILRWR